MGKPLACPVAGASIAGTTRALILLLVSAATLLPSTSRRVLPTPLEAFWALVSADSLRAAAAEQLIVEGWDDAHASILVEPVRLADDVETRRRIISVLERSTGRRLGGDLIEWWAWIWRANPGTHPEYAERLERLPAHRAFWFGWFAQYPETRLVRR